MSTPSSDTVLQETQHWLVQAVSGGNKINTDARYIHVYVKEKGGWKMAAHQSTYVVK